MHSAEQNFFSHCVGMHQEQGNCAMCMKKKRGITHQERHPEAYFLHVLNALKHDAFPFKNSEPTSITIPYFFGLSDTFLSL